MHTNGGYGTAGGSKGPSHMMLLLAVCLAAVLAALLSLSPRWQSR